MEVALKIYSKNAPARDFPSQEDLGSLTAEKTRRIVEGITVFDERSTVEKKYSIPRVMPILDLNFPARRRISNDGRSTS